MRLGLMTCRLMREVLAKPRPRSRQAACAVGNLEIEVTGVTRRFAKLLVRCKHDLQPVSWARRRSTFDHLDSLFFTMIEVIVLLDYFLSTS
jgi:hypothetical protein